MTEKLPRDASTESRDLENSNDENGVHEVTASPNPNFSPNDGRTSSEGEKGSPAPEDLQVTSSSKDKPPGKDYSSFSPWQKRFIVFAATMGAFFSPFTAQIYFPALTSIAKDLNVSNSKINLTMTTYMVGAAHPAYPFPLPLFFSETSSIVTY